MARKLFCEISPLTYKISQEKEILKRTAKNLFDNSHFAKTKSDEKLAYVIKAHRSLIRRKLNNVDVALQNNKAQNLAIAAPLVNGIIIKPGQTFSFWGLVGRPTKRKGYLDGVTIKKGQPQKGLGGGMCQFTNLLHWLVLHTPLDITEHHHHNGLDLFPDFNRQIPFGTGTSILYNYLDYRFKNNTEAVFQLVVYVTEEYLCGEIRADSPLEVKVHVEEKEAYFFEEAGDLYRHNKIYRKVVDKKTGNILRETLLLENNAKTMYDKSFVDESKIIIH